MILIRKIMKIKNLIVKIILTSIIEKMKLNLKKIIKTKR